MENDVFMEPITGVDRISKGRWKLVRLMLSVEDVYTDVLLIRDVPYATFEKELASSATNLRASLLSMPLVLAKRDY